MKRSRLSARGFTLVEVLFGLLILTVIITTSLAIFFERERRLRFAEETILVWQAIANEAEIRRHVPYRDLDPGSEEPFVSDLSILGGLVRPQGSVRVEQVGPGVKRVHLTVSWLDESRSVRTAIMRADTGGGELW